VVKDVNAKGGLMLSSVGRRVPIEVVEYDDRSNAEEPIRAVERFAYTISGKWGYLEHDWTATAGDFVYETPGESHTLVAYEHEEPMRTLFIV
jgi:hypothetical protein